MYRDTLEFEILFIQNTIKRLQELIRKLEERIRDRLETPIR